jgi:hypothetical protein
MQALADALARKHPDLGFTPRSDLGGSLLAVESPLSGAPRLAADMYGRAMKGEVG